MPNVFFLSLSNYCLNDLRSRDFKIPSISRKSWSIENFRMEGYLRLRKFFQPFLDKFGLKN